MSKTRAIGLVLAAAALVAASAASTARAAGTEKLPRVYALTGVRIVVAPGNVVEKGTVVLRDGVIEAAGATVQPPPDARVWDREGLTVYPGLIEPYSVRNAPETDGAATDSGGGEANAMLRPERDVTPYAADAAAAKKLREAGYATAVVAPAEGIVRGASVVLNLGDGPVGENLLRRELAQNVTLRSNSFGGGYPASLMGAVALVRQTLADARWHAGAWAA